MLPRGCDLLFATAGSQRLLFVDKGRKAQGVFFQRGSYFTAIFGVSCTDMEYINAVQSPVDVLKPSLFEILAEQQLAALLAPSIRYLLAITTHRYPRYLLRVLNNFDEAYALLGVLVERYYLRTFGGSFTENFYSLKREKVLNIRGGEVKRTQLVVPSEVRERLKLQGGDVWKNLAVLVGIPYLKRKLDESYDVHIAPSASLLGSSVCRSRRPTFKRNTETEDNEILQMVSAASLPQPQRRILLQHPGL